MSDDVEPTSEPVIDISTDDRRAHDVSVDDIHGDFVPIARSDVAVIEIDGQLVVARATGDPPSMQSCVLNETGAIVWQCFDGTGSLDEIAADVAATFAADLDVVLADVYALARAVGAAGLLVGVREVATHRAMAAGGIAVGTAIPEFEAADELGTTVASSALWDQATLVLNWSPTCGFCQEITGVLIDLVPALAARDIRVVLLATGGAAQNRELIERHAGSAASVRLLLVDRALPAFAGVGTPAAYLVDRGGVVIEALTIGSTPVANLARRAADATDA